MIVVGHRQKFVVVLKHYPLRCSAQRGGNRFKSEDEAKTGRRSITRKIWRQRSCSTSCSAALVRVQSDNSKDTPPGPFGYIGVAFTRREGIDVNVARARLDGVLPKGRSAI